MFTAKSSLPSFYLRSSIDQAINLLTVKTFKRLCIFLFALPKQHLPETEYAANSRSMTGDFFGVYFPPCDQNYSSEVRSVDGRYRGDYAAYWSQNLSIASLAEPNPESMNRH